MTDSAAPSAEASSPSAAAAPSAAPEGPISILMLHNVAKKKNFGELLRSTIRLQLRALFEGPSDAAQARAGEPAAARRRHTPPKPHGVRSVALGAGPMAALLCSLARTSHRPSV